MAREGFVLFQIFSELAHLFQIIIVNKVVILRETGCTMYEPGIVLKMFFFKFYSIKINIF